MANPLLNTMPVIPSSTIRARFIRNAESGWSLIDIMVTILVMGIIMATAIPGFRDFNGTFKLDQNIREVERTLQQARLKSVTANRPIRVRFNCPVAGDYRMVELIGTPSVPIAADAAADRCQATAYPFPAADHNPLTLPNQDGPPKTLGAGITFGAAGNLEFWPDGTVHKQVASENPWTAVPPTGTAITLVKGSEVKTITVNGLGKIQLVR